MTACESCQALVSRLASKAAAREVDFDVLDCQLQTITVELAEATARASKAETRAQHVEAEMERSEMEQHHLVTAMGQLSEDLTNSRATVDQLQAGLGLQQVTARKHLETVSRLTGQLHAAEAEGAQSSQGAAVRDGVLSELHDRLVESTVQLEQGMQEINSQINERQLLECALQLKNTQCAEASDALGDSTAQQEKLNDALSQLQQKLLESDAERQQLETDTARLNEELASALYRTSTSEQRTATLEQLLSDESAKDLAMARSLLQIQQAASKAADGQQQMMSDSYLLQEECAAAQQEVASLQQTAQQMQSALIAGSWERVSSAVSKQAFWELESEQQVAAAVSAAREQWVGEAAALMEEIVAEGSCCEEGSQLADMLQLTDAFSGAVSGAESELRLLEAASNRFQQAESGAPSRFNEQLASALNLARLNEELASALDRTSTSEQQVAVLEQLPSSVAAGLFGGDTTTTTTPRKSVDAAASAAAVAAASEAAVEDLLRRSPDALLIPEPTRGLSTKEALAVGTKNNYNTKPSVAMTFENQSLGNSSSGGGGGEVADFAGLQDDAPLDSSELMGMIDSMVEAELQGRMQGRLSESTNAINQLEMELEVEKDLRKSSQQGYRTELRRSNKAAQAIAVELAYKRAEIQRLSTQIEQMNVQSDLAEQASFVALERAASLGERDRMTEVADDVVEKDRQLQHAHQQLDLVHTELDQAAVTVGSLSATLGEKETLLRELHLTVADLKQQLADSSNKMATQGAPTGSSGRTAATAGQSSAPGTAVEIDLWSELPDVYHSADDASLGEDEGLARELDAVRGSNEPEKAKQVLAVQNSMVEPSNEAAKYEALRAKANKLFDTAGEKGGGERVTKGALKLAIQKDKDLREQLVKSGWSQFFHQISTDSNGFVDRAEFVQCLLARHSGRATSEDVLTNQQNGMRGLSNGSLFSPDNWGGASGSSVEAALPNREFGGTSPQLQGFANEDAITEMDETGSFSTDEEP